MSRDKSLDILELLNHERKEVNKLVLKVRVRMTRIDELTEQLEEVLNESDSDSDEECEDVLKNYGTRCEPLYHTNDVAVVLKLSNIRKTISGFDDRFVKRKCDIELLEIKNNKEIKMRRKVNMLTTKGVKRILSGTRKHIPENLKRQFGMEEYDSHVVPIETKIIERIKKIFPDENFKTQYKCKKYRIDLYHMEKNIAIEIDENNHDHYCQEKETLRTQVINEKLSPTWIRFDTNRPDTYDEQFGKLFKLLKK